jgi:hypothetical protein
MRAFGVDTALTLVTCLSGLLLQMLPDSIRDDVVRGGRDTVLLVVLFDLYETRPTVCRDRGWLNVELLGEGDVLLGTALCVRARWPPTR